MLKDQVDTLEVVSLLKQIIHEDLTLTFSPGYSWGGKYMTSTEIHCDKGTVLFFIDANELDYVDFVRLADGREGEFDFWNNAENTGCKNPLTFLTESEIKVLINKLDRAIS
ncbi:hypothetical protein FLL45_08015 [Aliikangiella marina]|uniref:DUF7693 domain-containing protein n=1 Tax=Aliikangiella marina TaxID=1712262 RepID=A0A545TCF3_9GAMM|nr:hypothetical protein [Aliikangiella marina]TQV74897.1 hypothetical protein FLL45_08015 [Aliikangiella marina]